MICKHCGSWDRGNWRTECLWSDGDGPCFHEERRLAMEQNDAMDIWTVTISLLLVGVGIALVVSALNKSPTPRVSDAPLFTITRK